MQSSMEFLDQRNLLITAKNAYAETDALLLDLRSNDIFKVDIPEYKL